MGLQHFWGDLSQPRRAPARRRELIRQYVALLKEHDDLIARAREQGGRPVPPVAGTRKNHAGNQAGPTSIAASKFGVTKRTVKRALAAKRESAEKVPKPRVTDLARQQLNLTDQRGRASPPLDLCRHPSYVSLGP